MQINKFAPVSSSEVIHGLFCSRKFHSKRWPIAAELMFAVSVSSELNVNSVNISSIRHISWSFKEYLLGKSAGH